METSFTGKTVGGFTYIHVSAAHLLSARQWDALKKAEQISDREKLITFNVIKIKNDPSKISLLYYASFFENPFPELTHSWKIDLDQGSVRCTCFGKSANPPILHKKELLLAPNHPRRPEFVELTAQLEQAGLYRQAHNIGFKRQWYDRLRDGGYTVENHCLVKLGGGQEWDHG